MHTGLPLGLTPAPLLVLSTCFMTFLKCLFYLQGPGFQRSTSPTVLFSPLLSDFFTPSRRLVRLSANFIAPSLWAPPGSVTSLNQFPSPRSLPSLQWLSTKNVAFSYFRLLCSLATLILPPPPHPMAHANFKATFVLPNSPLLRSSAPTFLTLSPFKGLACQRFPNLFWFHRHITLQQRHTFPSFPPDLSVKRS